MMNRNIQKIIVILISADLGYFGLFAQCAITLIHPRYHIVDGRFAGLSNTYVNWPVRKHFVAGMTIFWRCRPSFNGRRQAVGVGRSFLTQRQEFLWEHKISYEGDLYEIWGNYKVHLSNIIEKSFNGVSPNFIF